jgi:hypothetical protein
LKGTGGSASEERSISTDSLDSATSRPEQRETTKVLIVDDHAVLYQGLRTFLELHKEED